MYRNKLHYIIALALVLVLGGNVPAQVPPGWVSADVGSPAPGGASESGGTWEITGNGNDVYGTADNFHFVYQFLEGDGEISARVVDNGTGSNDWAKGGVMIRQDATAGSPETFISVTGGSGGGAAFQWRDTANAGSGWPGTHVSDISPPHWVRLVREGDTFTSYLSADGVNWEASGADPRTVSMTERVLIGLAVTSHADGELRTFTFDNVSYSGNVEGLIRAYDPDPADGALLEATWANISWSPGTTAVSHDVYLGENFDDVNDGTGDAFRGNQAGTSIIVGFTGYPYPDGLVPGTTYYWRVDEIEADGTTIHKGDIWSFFIPPLTAYQPVPADGATFVLTTDVSLNWLPGFTAKLHTVYFGEDRDTVAGAAGGVPVTDTTFAAGALESGKTYYWRVDESDPPVTHEGDVWSFTTVPDIPVADDANLTLWWTLDEGQGAAGPVDWSGHGEHAAVADDPRWIVDGYQRGALQFDGTDDYLYRSLAPAMPAQTVCAWTRVDEAPASILGWSNAHPTSGTHDRELYITADGATNWRVWTGEATIVTSVSTVADGLWHHIAGVYVDNGVSELYIDGVLQGSISASGIYNSYSSPFLTVGIDSQESSYLTGAVDDVRVYDKALTAEEIAQVMLGDTKLAATPVPERAALVDIRDISSLSWSRGDTAASHDVYLGSDIDAVAGADNSAPEFRGNQAGTSLSLAGLVEFGGGDYYWRVDKVEVDGTVHAGTIWKFTVPDYLIVDNFESYDDIDPAPGEPGLNRIFDKWIDGFGILTNGALVGNDLPPYAERTIVKSGSQSMIYRYDNAGKTSEATLTLANRDWTTEGVTKLSLWVRGDSANAADRIYVSLNGAALVYHDDPAATQLTGWNEWVIDLAAFGVDLTNVNSISIGVGTKNAPAPDGGTGTVYFDEIRLYR